MTLDLAIRFLFDMLQHASLYLLCTPVIPAKPGWKSCLIYVSIGAVTDILGYYFTLQYGPLNYLIAILMVFAQVFFAFRVKGKKLLACATEHLVCIYAATIPCAAFASLVLGFEYVAQAAENTAYKPVPLAVINIITILTFWAVLRGVLSLIRRENRQTPAWLPLARSIFMFIATLAVAAILLENFQSYSAEDKFSRVLLNFSLTGIMLVTVFSSLLQEVRSLRLRRWGETLEKEKETTDVLIRDLRVFRHNIINTLHGFRGVIASGNTEEQLQYYESLAQEVARLNNENALALQRLHSPALSALLMEKLNAAAERSLPMYLYTRGIPAFKGAQEKDICAIAGALIDNALEAALESQAGNVRVEIAQEGNETSLSVLNTCPDSLDVEAFLAGSPASTKEGHTGLGLSGVEAIVRKNQKLSFLRRTKGRYVECVLGCRES